MFAIRTFTLVSDFDEDRLRMDARNTEEVTQAIMLTRRLLDRAIPKMADEAYKLAAGPIPANLALPIAQQRLRQERRANPIPPVCVSDGVQPWLCVAMQFKLQGNAMFWVLKGHGGQEARMFLSNSNLRATLDVFAMQYRAMKWARSAFPEWLTEADLDPAPAGRALH